MKDHPLTPMTDSNLVSTLSRQTSQKVGLVEYTNISGGPSEIRKAFNQLQKEGVAIVVTDVLNDDIEDDDIVVNLASDEYFKSINKEKLNAEIITPVFKEFKNDSYKVIAIYAKKARGLMSRFLIERKSKNVDDIKLFNTDGYTFDGNLSTENELVFTR